MKSFIPKSMAGQTIVVLLVGLTLSHVFSMAIYSADRSEVLTLAGGRHIAHRIASITRLLDETPQDWRAKILHATDSPSLGVTVTPVSQLVEGQDKGIFASLLGKVLRRLTGISGDRQINVQLIEPDDTVLQQGTMQASHFAVGHMLHGDLHGRLLRASVQLKDGQWVNFSTIVSEDNPLWSSRAFFSMLLMAVGVVLLSLWVIQRVTKPLNLFAAASERLGKDVHAPALSEGGPLEIRQAAHAFNEMQQRLQRFIENRTQMLAAISHDLRTPITLLRLRAEYAGEGEDKERMLATLDEMEAMISSTLSFAREDTEKEETQQVDLEALIRSICDDMADTGRPVTTDETNQVTYDCRPVAMRRAIVNVIENAIKYGDAATVSLHRTGEAIEIAVVDNGPGIPEEEFEQVFTPFYRIERSRNRETGGVGLGLSVARTIVNGHGGDVVLSNRDGGGLRVSIVLPT